MTFSILISRDRKGNAAKWKARSSNESISTPTKRQVSKKAKSATALESSTDEAPQSMPRRTAQLKNKEMTAKPEAATKSTREKRIRKPSQKALAAMEISSDESIPEHVGNKRSSLDPDQLGISHDDEGWQDIFTQAQGVESELEDNNCQKSEPEDNRSPIKKKASQAKPTNKDLTPRAKHLLKMTDVVPASDSDQDDHLATPQSQHRDSPTPTTPKRHHKSTLLSAKMPIFPSIPALGTPSPQIATRSDKSVKQKTVTRKPALDDSGHDLSSDDNHSQYSNKIREKTCSHKKDESDSAEETTSKNVDDSAEETTTKNTDLIPGEETEATLELMPLTQRDPRLAEDYILLPLLRPAVMVSFGSQLDQIFMAQYSAVWESLGNNKIYQRLLKSAVKFSVSYPFVNPSHAPLSIIKAESGKLLVKDSESDFDGQNVVLLTTGIVTECALVNTVPTWGATLGTPGPPIKRLKLRPFTVEYERAVAYIGNSLGVKSTNYAGPIYNNGLAFTTRKAGFGQSPSTPSASSSNRFLSVSPTRSRIDNHDTGRGFVVSYPQCLNCHDDVPIYDARHEKRWAFRSDDLRQIGKLPRFKKGSADLSPDKFIAAVGYTVGSYRYSGSHERLADLSAVSLNVMFAVVLGEVVD
ncbi:hypothetical protein JOM56_014603 [Amanita muscaria]